MIVFVVHITLLTPSILLYFERFFPWLPMKNVVSNCFESCNDLLRLQVVCKHLVFSDGPLIFCLLKLSRNSCPRDSSLLNCYNL